MASSQVLESHGPLIDVTVRPDSTEAAMPGASRAISSTMLIDTGATCTMIDERRPRALGLTPTRKTWIGGITGLPVAHLVYRVVLILRMTDAAGRSHDIA